MGFSSCSWFDRLKPCWKSPTGGCYIELLFSVQLKAHKGVFMLLLIQRRQNRLASNKVVGGEMEHHMNWCLKKSILYRNLNSVLFQNVMKGNSLHWTLSSMEASVPPQNLKHGMFTAASLCSAQIVYGSTLKLACCSANNAVISSTHKYCKIWFIFNYTKLL